MTSLVRLIEIGERLPEHYDHHRLCATKFDDGECDCYYRGDAKAHAVDLREALLETLMPFYQATDQFRISADSECDSYPMHVSGAAIRQMRQVVEALDGEQ